MSSNSSDTLDLYDDNDATDNNDDDDNELYGESSSDVTSYFKYYYGDDDDDDDEDDSVFVHHKKTNHGYNPNNNNAVGGGVGVGQSSYLNFSEYDSEDDEIPQDKDSEEELERRRRAKKQLKRIFQQTKIDSGILLIDRFTDHEWDALLYALQYPISSFTTSGAGSTTSPLPQEELLSIIRLRRNSRNWTKTRTLSQIQQLFDIISNKQNSNHNLPSFIHLDITGFDDTIEEINALTNCLQYHPTITTIELDTIQVDSSIIQALITIPNLQSVTLDLRDSTPLGPLVRNCKTLKHLKVSSYYYFFSNSNDDQEAALDMIYALGGGGGGGGGNTTNNSASSLESLEIKLISDTMVQALMNMLRTNTSLKSVTFAALLDGDMEKANALCTDIATVLTVNTTLKSLIIRNELDVGEIGRNAILSVFCHSQNTTLEHLDFDWWRKKKHLSIVQEFDDHKHFFLAHHKFKTKQLRISSNAYSKRYWIDRMSEYSHDSKLLYYFLKMDPSLICGGNYQPTTREGQQEHSSTTTTS